MEKRRPPVRKGTSLQGECTKERPRNCELSVAVGYARDLARDAGVPAPEIDRLIRDGFESEREIKAALTATRKRLPESARKEADEVMDFLWPAKTRGEKGR